jgi:hypothetical protein
MGARMRKNYWACSKFADWLRGTPKNGAKTAEDWRDWRIDAKKKHSFRYWLAEEGLDKIQNFIWWPIDKLHDLKYYINNRYVTKSHCLTAHPRDIKPGQWRDVGNRFLPCLFNELVDFVEIEQAWWNIAWDKEARAKYGSPFWASGWFRWRTWRSPEAGLDSLKWQSELVWKEDEVGDNVDMIGKPTYQAERAKEIIALYKWWTEVYRNRPDVHDASGWSEYCDLKRKIYGDKDLDWFCDDKTPTDLKEMGNQSLKKSQEIEEAYEKEDEEMMIRLIKIRGSLWT